MLETRDILETIQMIQDENLDIRTVTMGISLLDCIDSDIDRACERIYEKITRMAENLVPVCQNIEKELGIPIINKRISVTPISIIAASDVSSLKISYFQFSFAKLPNDKIKTKYFDNVNSFLKKNQHFSASRKKC